MVMKIRRVAVEYLGNQPAAGANFSASWGTDGRFRKFVSLTCRLITSAAVVDRFFFAQFVAAGTGVERVGSPSPQLASTTRYYTIQAGPIFPGKTDQTGTVERIAIGPDYWIIGGTTFQTVVTNLQGGDQLFIAPLVYEEWY
jgi:hypothetical protein